MSSQVSALPPSRKRARSPTSPPISPTTPNPPIHTLPIFPPYAEDRLRRQLLARRIITVAHTHFISSSIHSSSSSSQVPHEEEQQQSHPSKRCTRAGHFCYRRPRDNLQDKCALCMVEGVDVMECRLECDEPVWSLADRARVGRKEREVDCEIFGGGRRKRRTVFGAAAAAAASDDDDAGVVEAKEDDDEEEVHDRTIIKAGKITFRDPFSGSGQKKVWEPTLGFRPARR
ncbi:MAG: hypothetical protein L6R37_002882 [Teloschistes peruensis]|nr:MAG: hypothetical protein L6R37_002882 [Teloschistes peruensis]